MVHGFKMSQAEAEKEKEEVTIQYAQNDHLIRSVRYNTLVVNTKSLE